MNEAWVSFWHNYFNFTGRSSRPQYWWMVLIDWILLALFSTLILVFNSAIVLVILGGLGLILLLSMVIPLVALTTRRLNDVGLPLWASIVLVVFVFIYGIGGLAIFVLSLFPSDTFNK